MLWQNNSPLSKEKARDIAGLIFLSYVSQFKHKTRKHNYVNFWFHKLCFL
ncbi:hypothetical protein MbovMil_02325 [Mycoplasmopsis bovis]